MSFREEKEMLERFGCKEIEYTNLINNYFIMFICNGKKFTIEHILNVYGERVDWWELTSINGERCPDAFDTLEELLNHIK